MLCHLLVGHTSHGVGAHLAQPIQLDLLQHWVLRGRSVILGASRRRNEPIHRDGHLNYHSSHDLDPPVASVESHH